MKKGIHPLYRPVVFRDHGAGEQYLIRSTIATNQTCEVNGVKYPLVSVDISSASHPFYTGKMKIVDTAGRVERFNRRYGVRKPPQS
ncbi:MAG: type B 50S ribosomal protein L31 [Actinomycetota bacterium]